MPSLTETRQLDVHGAIVLEHVVALLEETSKLADTDVLAHFQLGDLVELLLGDVAVVHAQDAALLLGDAGVAQDIVAPGSAVLSNGDTGDLGAVVDRGKLGEGAPAGANVKHGLSFLELELLADDGHLVVLELLEGLLARRVGDDAGGVNHAGTEEPGVVVVAGVVVGTDLFHVLVLGMEEDVDKEGEDDELEEVEGEAKVGPVVAVLKDVENVAVEVGLAIDVHFGEGLDGHLGATGPLGLVGGVLEGDVGLDGAAGELCIIVDALAVGGLEAPVGNEDGEEGEDAKEDLSLEATADETGEEPGDANQEATEDKVGEALAAGAFGGEGRVVDCSSLGGCMMVSIEVHNSLVLIGSWSSMEEAK